MKLLVVFDLDGTLVDSRRDITRSINAARESLGLPVLSMEKVLAAVGGGVRELVEGTFFDAAPSIRERAHTLIMEFYDRHTAAPSPYDGVEETLRELHGRSIAKAIVSNKPESLVRKIVREAGWDGAFGMVIGGETPIPMKPDPAGIHHARERMGLDPNTTIWMVGDGPHDMDAGHAAGAKCLWAKWGFHQQAPARVDVVLETPTDIVKLLMKATT